MQSLLGVDLFGTHGDDMKQISDKKEHQTQNRIRGEYENRDQLLGPRRRPPLRSAGLRKGVGGEAAPDGAGSRGERRAFCVRESDLRGVPDCSRVQAGAGGADGAAGLGVVGRARGGSDRGRQRDGGARGEAALVTEEGQQEAAADFGKAADRGERGVAGVDPGAAEALRIILFRNS